MAIVTMKNLLESGSHFGHQTRRWNPKMAPYIFTSRNGIHILDLQKTSQLLEKAYNQVIEIVKNGGNILFIGTKKQVQNIIFEEAKRCDSFYINNRWLGGILTNFDTIKKRIIRMNEIEQMEKDGTFDALTKKEVILLRKELDKLKKNLEGIRGMKNMPQAIFVVDPKKEKNAILEAKKLNIPVISIVDTNCDPDIIDYIIPANDDAIRSVKLIVGKIADAVIEAKNGKSEDSNISSDKEIKTQDNNSDTTINNNSDNNSDNNTKSVKSYENDNIKK